MRTPIQGYVTRIPKNDNEMKWETRAYEGEDPEGSFLYTFTNPTVDNPGGWKQIVYTRLDAEFFKSRPNDYIFEPLSGRPEGARPTRPNSVEYFDKKVAEDAPKTPLVNEMPAVAVEAPVIQTPKRRMGRPPKVEQTGAN